MSGTARDGRLLSLEILSRRGEECRLRNPWDAPCRLLDVAGHSRLLTGDICTFPTEAGQRYTLAPAAEAVMEA